ncbi:MAG: DoxX family protein [Bacteroidales bacterium]|jgi:uncharacterized membrane protein YphA (DoxX/SURF4 family)|nr:DoxX family protein [Bacteroidales bacterium]
MKILVDIARILLGAVFIFSGFVKGVDPLGSTYKFVDYFTAFHLTFLSPLAFTLALLQNAAETLIGIALLFRLRTNTAAWAVLLFMAFYTPLTFIIAMTNPVTDCGCFGDALILTNWQTFFKNIVLMALAVLVFVRRKKFAPVYSPLTEWICIAAFAVAVVGISIHGYRHLPLFDFRPYSIGSDIAQGMIVPEGMPADEFVTTLFYEKDGVVKEFPEQHDYPWNDPTWVWKDTKSVLVKKGYEPPIHDFSLVTAATGEDITDAVLSNEGYTFLLVAYRLDEANQQALKQADTLAQFCRDNGYGFYCLTSSLQDEIDEIKTALGLSYDFCLTDGIALKTIIRANPGLVLLEKGTVIDKWHFYDMPNAKELTPNLLSCALQHRANVSDSRLLYLLLSLFALAAFAFFDYRKK